MTSDAITYIMGTKNIVSGPTLTITSYFFSKEATEAAFHDLSSLFSKLGLPMNSEKETPPEPSICLGILIDIAGNTLSIDSDKLEQSYEDCIMGSHNTSVSRETMQSRSGSCCIFITVYFWSQPSSTEFLTFLGKIVKLRKLT